MISSFAAYAILRTVVRRVATPARLLAWLTAVVLLTAILAPAVTAADSYALEERSNPVCQVTNTVDVTGSLQTALREGKAVQLALDVKASLVFSSRPLPGAGRDARALRALRQYEKAVSTIKVDDGTTSVRLRDSRHTIVAEGQRHGIDFYSPGRALEHSEWELLRMPGDIQAILPLLPPKEVSIGETWQPDSWVVQCLTGTEAVLKSSLDCKLESVNGPIARIGFSGSVEGATDGAQTEITLKGHVLFDVKQKLVTVVELEQHEKRSVGAVSPGMDVTARVAVVRRLLDKTDGPAVAAAATVPLDPPETELHFEFRSPWNLQFHYDRNWHLFHQSAQVAVLRLLEKGSLIAQCNISRIPQTTPGNHTPEDQFQADIRQSLGERLTQITRAEQIKTGDDRYLYRVTAEGTANKIDMVWIFYLCAAPDGRQVSFVFAVEKKLLEQLDNRDLGMVSNLQFTRTVGPQPAAASRPEAGSTRE